MLPLGCLLLEASFFIGIGSCSIPFFLAFFAARSIPFRHLRLQRRLQPRTLKVVKITILYQQSWTKVLTHLSKTNAFYRRSSVISKNTFLSIANPPLSPFSMLQYAPWALSSGYNMGGEGRNVKIGNWKTHAFNEQVFSESVSTAFVHDCTFVSVFRQ